MSIFDKTLHRAGNYKEGFLTPQPSTPKFKSKDLNLIPTATAMDGQRDITEARPPEEMIRSDGRNVLRVPGLAEYVLRPANYPKTKQELLSTPKASDGQHPGSRKCNPGQTQHLSCQVIPEDAPKGAKLNPDFVEFMMGFPENWLNLEQDCDGIPHLMSHADLPEWMPKAVDCNDDPDRKNKLKALGNAVVPFCSAIAWMRLAEYLD